MYKIPEDAFQVYVSLGLGRSYEALAKRYNCSKRAILKRATRDHWRQQLRDIQQNARAAAIEQMQREATTMQVRHLAGIHFIQKRAIDVLKEKPITNAKDAVWALTQAQREERALFGGAQPQNDVTKGDEPAANPDAK